MSDTATLPDYAALGQTADEAALLRKHDEGETLHPFVADGDDSSFCAECGDTEEGLMHNNTWRNVEPLMGRKTVLITLSVTYDENEHDHPSAWAWDELIDAANEHDVSVVRWEDVDA